MRAEKALINLDIGCTRSLFSHVHEDTFYILPGTVIHVTYSSNYKIIIKEDFRNIEGIYV